MVPDEASCRIVNAFLVTDQFKGKMTRECDLSQVNFINKGFESTTNLHVKKQSLEVVETHEVGLRSACTSVSIVHDKTLTSCLFLFSFLLHCSLCLFSDLLF